MCWPYDEITVHVRGRGCAVRQLFCRDIPGRVGIARGWSNTFDLLLCRKGLSERWLDNRIAPTISAMLGRCLMTMALLFSVIVNSFLRTGPDKIGRQDNRYREASKDVR